LDEKTKAMWKNGYRRKMMTQEEADSWDPDPFGNPLDKPSRIRRTRRTAGQREDRLHRLNEKLLKENSRRSIQQLESTIAKSKKSPNSSFYGRWLAGEL